MKGVERGHGEGGEEGSEGRGGGGGRGGVEVRRWGGGGGCGWVVEGVLMMLGMSAEC